MLNEALRNFNNHLTLTEDRHFKGYDFWYELQMDVEKLLAHLTWTYPGELRFIRSMLANPVFCFEPVCWSASSRSNHFCDCKIAFLGDSSSMSLMGKIFGRPKRKAPQVQDTICWASDKAVRRAARRIFAKYEATVRKLAE